MATSNSNNQNVHKSISVDDFTNEGKIQNQIIRHLTILLHAFKKYTLYIKFLNEAGKNIINISIYNNVNPDTMENISIDPDNFLPNTVQEKQDEYNRYLEQLDRIVRDILTKIKKCESEILTLEEPKYKHIKLLFNELKNNDYTVFTTYISNLTKYLPDEDVSSNMAYITNIEKSALELNESLTIYYSSDDSNKTAAWEDVITKQKKYVECENVVLEFIKTTNFK